MFKELNKMIESTELACGTTHAELGNCLTTRSRILTDISSRICSTIVQYSLNIHKMLTKCSFSIELILAQY